jgi:hypothetical protein
MPIPAAQGPLAEQLPAESVGVPFVAEPYSGARARHAPRRTGWHLTFAPRLVASALLCWLR